MDIDLEDKDKALDPTTRLISFSGKDALKAALDARIDNREELLQFIQEFRELRTVKVESAKPVMDLLEMGGFTGNRRSRAILYAMRDAMKRQIVNLDQEQLETLLNRCYTYLTIRELASIPIATLERMTYVDPGIWNQIVDHGLNDSPYVDLPISLKRRIWVSESSAFDHEIYNIIKRVPERGGENMSFLVDKKKRKLSQQENPVLHDLLRVTQGLSEELIAQAVDKMVEAAGEASSPKRIAIANLFHDFMVRMVPRAGSHMESLHEMAVFLDSADPLDAEPKRFSRLRNAFSVGSSCGRIALLVASTYSRDFLADQLILYLLNRRGEVPSFTDEVSLAAAGNHVRDDPGIPNLTFLCMANMKADVLITRSGSLNNSEVDQPFEVFYPMMINEMFMDVTQSTDDYFTQNATLPNDGLEEMVRRGRLERRVLTSYCLQLFSQEILVGLARFRLLLDTALSSCDSTEETREMALATALIERIIQG